ncbi:MAG: cadherin repeat domain-containing protein [Leptospira sp.]|nr:cadherin repeat domain-containing protein [Leptospira sp.]
MVFAIPGIVMVTKQLDYEQTKEYVITVQASDGGSPSLSSTAVIKIDVTDANDNRPVFVQAEYQAVVREDVPVNTSLLQVRILHSAENPLILQMMQPTR